jgi:hypothetical protein
MAFELPGISVTLPAISTETELSGYYIFQQFSLIFNARNLSFAQ